MTRTICNWMIAVALLTAGVIAVSAQQQKESTPKPRVVITADPELDDNNTLIRAILYSSDFKIEGLVYVSSQFHWTGDGKGTTQYIPGREYSRMGLCPCISWRWAPDERFIDNIVDAYAKAYPNLKVHDPDYPPPATLKSKIKWGNIELDGDFSKDTDGSNLIKSLLLDDQPGPLYVTAQGGESTIARALKSIYDEYAKTPQWNAIREKVSTKLIIIPSGDQDGTGAGYIRPNWPEVKEWQFEGGPNFGYGAQIRIAPEDKVYVSAAWTEENVLSRGPLGALYRVWGDGKQMVKGDKTDYFGLSGYTADQLKQMGYMVWMPPQEKGSFLGEGDTPTFINLVDIGLREYENPSWGGWGGHLHPANEPLIDFFSGGYPVPKLPANTSGIARGVAPAGSKANTPGNEKIAPLASIDFSKLMPKISPRAAAISASFFAAAQNDFADRLKWAVTPKFSDANHPPKVSIKGRLDISARLGDTVQLEGEVSDPDQNTVTVKWWQYNDAGTYPGDITISAPTELKTTFRVPDDAKPGQTIHVILEATDSGTPPLTRYQRVIVTVR
ncbi:MAG TPA: nucleoside hydrolase-like domain-containing protein [Terriglobales bacterium]|nr:nucleoside hydrolase-like domain-containing protein [Terriglobales bacterium]